MHKCIFQNALFVGISLVTISNSKHFLGRREKVHLVYKHLSNLRDPWLYSMNYSNNFANETPNISQSSPNLGHHDLQYLNVTSLSISTTLKKMRGLNEM